VSITLVADIVLVIAAVAWILFKQVQPAPVKPRLLVIVPVVLAYFGITTTAAKTWSNSADLLLVILGAAISVALGIPRGATIRVWATNDGRWWRQGSKTTLVLWGALFVARGVLYVIAEGSGHRAASGVGPLLLALALSFGAQNVVIAVKLRPGAESDEPAAYPFPPTPGRSQSGASSPPSLSSPGTPYTRGRVPAYAEGRAAGSLHERAAQRRADRRARRAARRQEW
jgi:hypothetical protein